jgi:L-ascorbate metabolism protein UlaG (beta-lactamase superfamily)
MSISRRDLFKGIGAGALATGLSYSAETHSENSKKHNKHRSKDIGIEWLGHGSFVFTSCKGKKILFDPWISTNPKCPGKYKKKGCFGDVDIILWTHGHVDHFMLSDAESLITEYNPAIIAPWELSFFIKSEIPSADTKTFTLANKGATADFEGIKITMTEAFHSAGAQLTGFKGTNLFVGEAVGYIIEFENGVKIYHSGDTSLMAGMKTIIGDYYKPDIAILPIGGVFTMGPDQAAYACKLIQPSIVIPEHFMTFPVLTQDTERFKEQVKKQVPDIEVTELGFGEIGKI